MPGLALGWLVDAELPGMLLGWALSYLIGSIPTGFLLVRYRAGTDIRTVGSGNIGATNVARVVGSGLGVTVLVLDICKGLAAVLVIAPWLLGPVTLTGQLSCGLCAVLGHTCSVFLRFQGGKGVATAIGVLTGAVPPVAGVCALIWLAVFLCWRYVSVASIAAAVALPITQILSQHILSDVLLGAVLALLIIVRHRANLERLLQGREPRFGTRDGPGTRPG